MNMLDWNLDIFEILTEIYMGSLGQMWHVVISNVVREASFATHMPLMLWGVVSCHAFVSDIYRYII